MDDMDKNEARLGDVDEARLRREAAEAEQDDEDWRQRHTLGEYFLWREGHAVSVAEGEPCDICAERRERRERLTDEQLRRVLDRPGLPRAIRLREQRVKMERGIGPAGRTYTLYDKTDQVLPPVYNEPPFDKPARRITLAEVDQWLELIENIGIEEADPETMEVLEITQGMGAEARGALKDRLVRARGGQP